MTTSAEALQRLRDGNRRFVANISNRESPASLRPIDLATQQRPFATVLGCSGLARAGRDRVRPGLGDLFVIRVAGNIVAPSQIGSVEFAASVRHAARRRARSHAVRRNPCDDRGVAAAADHQSRNLRSIVDRVRPSVEVLMRTDLRHNPDALVHHAVRANVSASVNHLRHGSELLEQLILQGKLLVVGAEYSLETGEVEFFDESNA
jgi:carbonic anhydrase